MVTYPASAGNNHLSRLPQPGASYEVDTISSVSSGPILDAPWPTDLDPAAVPFKTRTETVLRRAGYYDNPHRFDTLTEAEVMGWWNAGVATVADVRFTGNRAIRRHLEETDERSEMNVALAGVAAEPWAPHIWHRDPRFTHYVPKAGETVEQIAVSGHPIDRRALWGQLDDLRAAMAVQAALSLPDAVANYVEAISGQHGRRLQVLLARIGLNGRDPIYGTTAARMLGVSPARVYQIQDALERHRIRARPPAGVWMPQMAEAERFGWPDDYTDAGIAVTRAFLDVS